MTTARRRIAAIAAALTVVPAIGACTSGGGTPSAPPSTVTSTVVRTAPHTSLPTAPVSTGPTTATRADACPLVGTTAAADRVGMRLDRIVVVRSGGRVVGCRFYALQNSPLHTSERLPGPNQPAIEITTTRYPSAVAAHNAFVVAARAGKNLQRATISVDNEGACYQTDFLAADAGRDWACGFSAGTTTVLVRTVVISPALNVILVAREIARKL